MDKLPYFFVLLKKNIALWTLIATGSFSKIDTVHTEYTRIGPGVFVLKNYALGNTDTFEEVWLSSGQWLTSIDFSTSNSKYQDSMKYYFGTNSVSSSVDGGYTLNGVTVYNSTEMLEPIDIGLDRKVTVSLERKGEHEYMVTLTLAPKNWMELVAKDEDNWRKADSVQNGVQYGPMPYILKLVDSSRYIGMDIERELTANERIQLTNQRIGIVNKAIRADSTYAGAYILKFGWETELRRYDSLIGTGKKLLHLIPDEPDVMYRIGEAYELIGKIDSARVFYEKALPFYDEQIFQTSESDRSYNGEMAADRALVLILLNREQEGRAIFKQLSGNPGIKKYQRELYREYLVTPRDKFLKEMKP